MVGIFGSSPLGCPKRSRRHAPIVAMRAWASRILNARRQALAGADLSEQCKTNGAYACVCVCIFGEPLSFRFAVPICASHRFGSCIGHARCQCSHNNDQRMAPTLLRKTEWRRSKHVDQISQIPLRTPPSTGSELAIAPHSHFACCLQVFCSVWLCSLVPTLLLEVLMGLLVHHNPPRHQRQHRLRSPTIPCPRTLGPFRPFSRHPTQPRPPRPPRNA